MYVLRSTLEHLQAVAPHCIEGQVTRGVVLASMAGLTTAETVALVWASLGLEDEPSTIRIIADILADCLQTPFEEVETELLQLIHWSQENGPTHLPLLARCPDPELSIRISRDRIQEEANRRAATKAAGTDPAEEG